MSVRARPTPASARHLNPPTYRHLHMTCSRVAVPLPGISSGGGPFAAGLQMPGGCVLVDGS
jgi:hypothetical protein